MPARQFTDLSESNEFRVALEALQNQITTRFPTREDIKTALDALQSQLDQRFTFIKELIDCKFLERDRRYDGERIERDKAIAIRVTQVENSMLASEKLELGHIQTVNERIGALMSEVQTINSASEKAIAKAEASVEKRFDTFDKGAQGLRELVNGAMPRAEVITLIGASTDKINALTDRINRSEGRGIGMGQIWSYIVGAGGVIVAVLAMFTWFNTLGPKIERNSEDLRRQQIVPAATPVPVRP